MTKYLKHGFNADYDELQKLQSKKQKLQGYGMSSGAPLEMLNDKINLLTSRLKQVGYQLPETTGNPVEPEQYAQNNTQMNDAAPQPRMTAEMMRNGISPFSVYGQVDNAYKSFMNPIRQTIGDTWQADLYKNQSNYGQAKVDDFKTNTESNYSPDPYYQDSISGVATDMAGETVRNIAGYAASPLFGTPTYNKVVSEQYPAFRERGLGHAMALDKAQSNGTLDARNVLDLPGLDKVSRMGKIAGKYAPNIIGDDAVNAIGRYADDVGESWQKYKTDINPELGKRWDDLSGTPFGQKIGDIYGTVRDKVSNSELGKAVGDAIPEVLKDKNFILKGVSAYSKSLEKNTVSQIAENRRQQEIGIDVGTFDGTVPTMNDLQKSGLDTVIDKDIWEKLKSILK